MRVSIINLNLVNADAIGQSMLHQLRFHQRRGDEVRVFVMHGPDGIPADLAKVVRVVDGIDLIGRQDEFFQSSDLYVYHYPKYYDLMDSIKTLDHGAVVFYYHNVTPPELWGTESGREEQAQGQAAVAKFANLSDLVVTVSPYNADELANDYGVSRERIRIMPLAAPMDRFKPGEADLNLVRRYGLAGKEVLLYVGRVAGNKRVDLLVDALAKVKAQRPNAVLLIVGDNDSNAAFAEMTGKIRARIRQLGLENDVIFTGRVDEVSPYYHLAALYVSASFHEGFGVPLVEAMASGVPIVTTNAGAQPWVLGDAGIQVTPGDTDELAAQIIKVLNDDSLYGELVQRGLQRAVDFSLEAYDGNWGQIITEVQEWLVAKPARPLRLSGPPQVKQGNAVAAELLDLPLQDEIKQLHHAAESVIKPYQPKSNVPIIGPMIVWLRRNLTSHLREPYLDPTLRRQERFNWLVVQTMRQINRLFEEPTVQDVALDQRVTHLEAQVSTLLELFATELAQIRQSDPAARDGNLARLQEKINTLRQQMPVPVAELPSIEATKSNNEPPTTS